MVATRYYDEDLLANWDYLMILDGCLLGVVWENLLEWNTTPIETLPLNFQAHCMWRSLEGLKVQMHISCFVLQGKLYELNLNAFNEIFGFSPCLDLSLQQGPRE